MKFYASLLIAMAASVLGATTASSTAAAPSLGSASVVNNCSFTIYLTSNTTSPPGIVTLPPGYSVAETFQTSATDIMIAPTPAFGGSNTSIEFTFDLVNVGVLYDLTYINGNPFPQSSQNLIPSDSSCPSYVCPTSDPGCVKTYSQWKATEPHICGDESANLIFTLCPTT